MRRVVLIVGLLLALWPVAFVRAAVPGITVLEPEEGVVIAGDRVTVRVEANNFRVVPSNVPLTESGKRPDLNRAGEGYIRLTLDLWPVVAVDGNGSHTFENIPPGEHMLKVELVNNDHSPLDQPISKTIRFRTTATTTQLPVTSAPADPLARLPLLLALVVVFIAGGFILRRYALGRSGN